MNRPNLLRKGDKVAIISLSSGILGEAFCEHQKILGEQRLKSFGLIPAYMKNSCNGLSDLSLFPEKRAADLKDAFKDDSIKAIICAIGGNDTYKTLPYLMDDANFIQSVQQSPKIFTGFSDTTINHLMFYKLGLQTFYGPNFLNDLAELDNEMLPYTKEAFSRYFTGFDNIEIKSSPIWYEERVAFSKDYLGTSRICHPEQHGYEVLRGTGVISGTLLGGCLESIVDLLTIPEMQMMNQQYQLVPAESEWVDKILFIETSEDQPSLKEYSSMLTILDNTGILQNVKGIIVGKPQNERHYQAYKNEIYRITEPYKTPILYNVNFGHAYPRCILPYGDKITINLSQKELILNKV